MNNTTKLADSRLFSDTPLKFNFKELNPNEMIDEVLKQEDAFIKDLQRSKEKLAEPDMRNQVEDNIEFMKVLLISGFSNIAEGNAPKDPKKLLESVIETIIAPGIIGATLKTALAIVDEKQKQNRPYTKQPNNYSEHNAIIDELFDEEKEFIKKLKENKNELNNPENRKKQGRRIDFMQSELRTGLNAIVNGAAPKEPKKLLEFITVTSVIPGIFAASLKTALALINE